MAKFSEVRIIYNPNSTGNSKSMALKLRRELKEVLTRTDITCIPTKYAGHARELAAEIAKKSARPLIISSSGDGGYNEVINGYMDAGNSRAVCAVLPAGNANDHSRTMQDNSLLQQIQKGTVSQLDLLKVTVIAADEVTTRYAHSYAGLGITPVIGAELNRHEFNRFNEIILALKTFQKLKPFKINRNGKVLKLDSLIFGNINQMAKVLTIAPENNPDDGMFEVVAFKSGSKRKLLKRLAKAAVMNLTSQKTMKVYKFKTIKKIPMQLDGEIIKLPADSLVTVESSHKALATII